MAVLVAGAFAIATSIPTYIGKGDVQTLFGWNNATMQTNHEGVSFEYGTKARYSFTCSWTIEAGPNTIDKEVDIKGVTRVAATVASGSRKTGQWTGWNLTPPTELAQPVEPGDSACNQYHQEATISNVQLIGEVTGGLYAVFNGDARLLP
jgi:hypothetical protein